MKTERKKQSLTHMVDEAKQGLRELIIDRPGAWVTQARARLENLPKTNFDLGVNFALQGKWTDALFRFRVCAYFAPDYPGVWYNIGCAYYRTGKLPQAQEALKKALQQKPNHTEAIFMLAAINPSALPQALVPKRMPADMVNGFFGSLAENYDIEEARNSYQGGKATFDVVKPLVTIPAPRVLDLACGTGIAARPWRASAASITGVDSTPSMIALAQKATHADKPLYDRLITADIAAPVGDITPASADVVLLVNSAQFVGELVNVMKLAALALAPGGVFILTFEPYARADSFGLSLESGRFGHGAQYVKQTSAAVGLSLAKEAKLALYPGTNIDTYIFTKA